MKICEWSQEYSVGIAEIDGHHHRLFEILNELFTLMAEGSEDKSIIHVIEELLNYTHYHFDEEERIMAKMKYPELAQHQRLHQELIQILKNFHKESQGGMAVFVAIKVADIGLAWLKHHILTVDHKYYEYMKEQAV
jgi:hemerythrin-like metal-binding protein